MKVLVFIDHDIICRNFLMSGALSSLVSSADVRFVFPNDEGKRMKQSPSDLKLNAPHTLLPIDAKRQQIWRWLLFRSQLKLRRGLHEASIRRLRWSTLGWKAALLLTLAGFPLLSRGFERYTNLLLARRPATELDELLDHDRPDVVFHPSVLEGVFINDLTQACKARHIPLVVAMNSWDNPSTKRAVVGIPDYLLVWGEQTQDHAVRFVGMNRASVIPFGAAQFDILRNTPRMDRTTLLSRHGLDPSLFVVLYAGSNARTDEIAALKALDSAVSEGQLPGVAVIYRPHPWGGGGKAGQRLAGMDFKNIAIDISMLSYIEALGRGNPGITLPDSRDTHDLLCGVDAVVSPMSTILIEAAILGKPVVVHAPTNDQGRDPLANGLPMLHFKEFLALPDVITTRDEPGVIQAIATLSSSTERTRRGQNLQFAARRFVASFERPWRDRIVDFVCDLPGKRHLDPPS
jgi:hypothetical protein